MVLFSTFYPPMVHSIYAPQHISNFFITLIIFIKKIKQEIRSKTPLPRILSRLLTHLQIIANKKKKSVTCNNSCQIHGRLNRSKSHIPSLSSSSYRRSIKMCEFTKITLKTIASLNTDHALHLFILQVKKLFLIRQA